MRYLSPLRYPGGKAKLAPFLQRVIEAQDPRPRTYAEPFAGGVGAGLRLLCDGVVDRLLINDLNPGVAAFWRTLTTQTDALCELITTTSVTIDEWHHQREIYFNGPAETNDLTLGFATFFLNRTNRSGILTARPIGGLDQEGKWKIDARYNKANLIKRVRHVARFRESITVTEIDALEFVTMMAPQADDVLLYVDPPYLQQGGRLYLNQFSRENHENLAEILTSSPVKWVLTYDDDKRIYTNLYEDHRLGRFQIPYRANRHRLGTELVAFSDHVHVPDLQITKRHAAEAV